MQDNITPEKLFITRRKILSLLMGALSIPYSSLTIGNGIDLKHFTEVTAFDSDDEWSSFRDITHYNNYYEFSTNKKSVALLAKHFNSRPWKIIVDGLVEKPIQVSIEELINTQIINRYIYRLRCVEGWSMVIPWNGFVLSELIKAAVPKQNAKFVRFESIYRPEEMIGQRRNTMEWPYVEGLRLDEALNSLTILAVGVYDKPLPNQNGAPIRLVVPWKYGFKSIKAVSKITLVDQQPLTTWMKSSPSEYGFYANVNPKVAHPRWSQRRELRIGERKKRKTLMFNGYEDHVSHLYKNMDLEKNF